MSSTLSDWVKAARKHASLTQSELGEKVGRGKQNVHAWEKGLHLPSFEQVQQISAVTGYPMPVEEQRGEYRVTADEPKDDANDDGELSVTIDVVGIMRDGTDEERRVLANHLRLQLLRNRKKYTQKRMDRMIAWIDRLETGSAKHSH